MCCFFKQKTAYEMRISDGSSDVCSSDLLHVDAMKAGTFDAGYTLEPNGTVMNKTGAAHTVEAGVVSKYIIGRESAYAFMAGGAITGKRSEARRVGEACVSTCRSRGSAYH